VGQIWSPDDPARRARAKYWQKNRRTWPILAPYADQGASIGEVFHARDRGLRTQGRPCFNATLERDPEAGIVPYGSRVIAVFISRSDHHDPETDDVAQAMLNFRRIARIARANSISNGYATSAAFS